MQSCTDTSYTDGDVQCDEKDSVWVKSIKVLGIG